MYQSLYQLSKRRLFKTLFSKQPTFNFKSNLSSKFLFNFSTDTQGKIIKCKAAVCWEPKSKLDYTDIEVHPPQKGEVRVKVISNALCHTDIYTLDGLDPEGLFPCILGHEATAIVESIGEGVTSVNVGDTVIPCYTPECREPDCIFCSSEKTNLCPKIRSSQGKGLMPDGTTRFYKDSKPIYHFMGCSTFSEYTVLSEISVAKINPEANLNHVCMLGCGVATGWGAVWNTCNVQPNSSVVVFELGAVGLAVVQAAKEVDARFIVGVDMNSQKQKIAQEMGVNLFVNPNQLGNQPLKDYLMEKEIWGYDYTFDCTGNTSVMRLALEVAHRGWGESCVIGVAAAGHEIQTRPFQLVTGRVWKGTAFGGWKSRTEVPQLVNRVMLGELKIDQYVTHEFDGLDKVNESIEALHSGECLRAIVKINQTEKQQNKTPKLLEKKKVFDGYLYRLKHWSKSNQCNMTFSIYVPQTKRGQSLPPILYYLSGLTCTDDNARTKGNIMSKASEYRMAVVFPDTSPRDIKIEGMGTMWDFGLGAGFYINATQEKYKKHFNMFDYVNIELQDLVSKFFTVDASRCSITGHSMGGHGALISALKNPGKYKSVSAFSPICNPSQTPWGIKAFKGYLNSQEEWAQYDALELIKNSNSQDKQQIKVRVGSKDEWNYQLNIGQFKKECDKKKWPLDLQIMQGMDHSYFFISSVMEQDLEYHAHHLGQWKGKE